MIHSTNHIKISSTKLNMMTLWLFIWHWEVCRRLVFGAKSHLMRKTGLHHWTPFKFRFSFIYMHNKSFKSNHITNSQRFSVPWSRLTVALPGSQHSQISSAPGVGFVLSHSIYLTSRIITHYTYYGILFQKFIRHFSSSAMLFVYRYACAPQFCHGRGRYGQWVCDRLSYVVVENVVYGLHACTYCRQYVNRM